MRYKEGSKRADGYTTFLCSTSFSRRGASHIAESIAPGLTAFRDSGTGTGQSWVYVVAEDQRP